jgi:hypothetical protein
MMVTWLNTIILLIIIVFNDMFNYISIHKGKIGHDRQFFCQPGFLCNIPAYNASI